MNRFVRFEYKEQPLPSVDDYTNDGFLSLEAALEPVLSQVDHLDQFIKKAKKDRRYPSEYNLTEDESAAIYLYTDDRDGQRLHHALNQALQSTDRALITPWLGFLKLFKNALEKLPTIKDTIWRGLPVDIANQLKDHEEIVCWGFTSCSMSVDIIKSFLDDNSILCSVKPFNAKNIHGYTPFANDHEVLLLPGTHLQVKYEEQKSGIYFEEISDVIDEKISDDVIMKSPVESSNEEDSDHLKIVTNNGSSLENEIKAGVTFSEGDRYKLTYQNEKKHGYGRYYSIDKGPLLEGQDADNAANGEGICAFQNGDRFIGTFKCGVRRGHGILYRVNGLIQAGEWTNDDELIAQNLQTLSHGDHYKWNDEKGKERCYAVYLDTNGNKYIGNVVDNKAEGLGIRIWSDNSGYEGNFKNDKKHGYGIYRYTNSAKYKGEWADDEINGDGKFIWDSGTHFKGQFDNGKKHGQGKLVFANGKINEGNWHNDEYVR